MDRIDKVFQKLTEKERTKIRQLLSDIAEGTTSTLDIKKLKGVNDIFRARKGDLRVLYRVEKKQVYLLAIERRGDNTYRFPGK